MIPLGKDRHSHMLIVVHIDNSGIVAEAVKRARLVRHACAGWQEAGQTVVKRLLEQNTQHFVAAFAAGGAPPVNEFEQLGHVTRGADIVIRPLAIAGSVCRWSKVLST